MKKKLLYLSLVICSAFVSCGSEDSKADEKANAASISPSSISMYFDGERQLIGNNVTSWNSNNDFVASVDENGLVKGAHVGTTQIIGSNGKTSASCQVEIKAKYNLYDTPILEWGASRLTIKNKETHVFKSSSTNADFYDYSKNGESYLLEYLFENDRLKSVSVMGKLSLFPDFGYYLIERYSPISNDPDLFMFADGYTKDKMTTIVGLQTTKISGTTLSWVMYISSNSLSTKASYDDIKANDEIITDEKIQEFIENMK